MISFSSQGFPGIMEESAGRISKSRAEPAGSDTAFRQTGYDQWGYNYREHLFKGSYCDVYRDEAWCRPYKDVELIMKWNDAWLDSMDHDGDGLLDRHAGFESYLGSGAWLTNRMSGAYERPDGRICHWGYFVKIAAANPDWYAENGIWHAADGTAVGAVVWGAFAIIQQIENDTCDGMQGAQFVSPVCPGYEKFKLFGWNNPR